MRITINIIKDSGETELFELHDPTYFYHIITEDTENPEKIGQSKTIYISNNKNEENKD